MQTSTPAAKKTGQAKLQMDSDAVISPIGKIKEAVGKVHSQRERKPRKWEDFETGEPSTSKTSAEASLKRKSAVNTSEDNLEEVAVEVSHTLEQLKEEQTSLLDMPTESPETFIVNQKKGRKKQGSVQKTPGADKPKGKKPKASKSKEIDGSFEQSELEPDKDTSVSGKRDSLKESVDSVKELTDDEQKAKLRQAIESKRKIKQFNKEDRQMVRDLDEGQIELDETDERSQLGGDSNASGIADKDIDLSVKNSVFKTPKRGRPKQTRKNQSKGGQQKEDDLDTEKKGNRSLNDSEDPKEDSDVSFGSGKGKRGRKKINYADLNDVNIENGGTEEDEVDVPKSSGKRGRKKKEPNNSAMLDLDVDDEVGKKLNNSKGTSKRGRKRKDVSYLSVSDQDLEETSSVNDGDEELNKSKGISKRGRKRKNVDYSASEVGVDDDLDLTGRDNTLKTPDSAKKKRGRPRKTENKYDDDSVDGEDAGNDMSKSIQCLHCSYQGKGVPDIRKHCAIQHQVLWSKEHPEGESTTRALHQVIKMKGFLNCPKCDKQINFVTYYPNHLEWCGREHETYVCEYCNKVNLVLRWRDLHLKTCSGLAEKMFLERKEKEKEESDEEEPLEPGQKRKRKAAKKARETVQNLSKNLAEVEAAGDSDKDPDADFPDDDDDDEDEYEDDDAVEEESIGTPEEEDDDDDDDVIDMDDSKSAGGHGDKDGVSSRRGLRSETMFLSYPLMHKYVKDNWSDHVFTDWLPRKKDWVELVSRDCKQYLPKATTSMKFSFKAKDDPVTLGLYEAQNIDGSIFYTGLCIWKIAWCPVPVECNHNQYIAVTGKLDYETPFLTDQRYVGPSVIQIWNTTIDSNKVKPTALPCLYYTLALDYGHITEMKWCPSGCYRSNDGQNDDSAYTRLGLLAVSFTDGTGRIFSLPCLPEEKDSEAPIFKASPVLALLPYMGHEKDEITCSSIDWFKGKGHMKIVAGYSNGSVRLFNLASKSSLQLVKTGSGQVLLPYRCFQPHGNLVRAVSWSGTLDSIIITCSDSFDLSFWDLNNLGLALYEDNGYHMTTAIESSVMQLGVFLVSDDNYAMYTNKGRYLDSGHIMMHGSKTNQRKEDRANYYISSQSACIWGVTYSDWVGMVATCDNRGWVFGLLPRDFMKGVGDCKSYRYRQILVKTEIKDCSCASENGEQSFIAKEENTLEQCGTSQKTCEFCSSIQSDGSLQKTENAENGSQSDSALHQCTCDKYTEMKDTQNSAQTSAEETANEKVSKKKDYSHLAKNSVLVFHEFRQKPKYLPSDKNCDRYDKPNIAALKSICFNPNNFTSGWMAFGGSPGLVRLVNMKNMFNPLTRRHMIKHNIY